MPTIYVISKPQHKIFIETALALTKGGRDYWANSPESVVMRDHWDVSMGGCLVFWKLSLITPHSIFFTHHSSLITHHLSLKLPQFPKPHPFGTYFQLLITQCFLLFVGPIPEHLVKYFLMFMLFSASYFLFLFFFPSTPNTQTHRTQIALKHHSSPPSSSIHRTQHPIEKNYHRANHKTSNQSTIADPTIHTTNTFNTTTNYTIKLRKN